MDNAAAWQWVSLLGLNVSVSKQNQVLEHV